MSHSLDRAQHYQAAIRLILLREWDPIGVSDEPAAQDEYDSYIHEIHGMLIQHEPKHRIIDHLWWIETEQLGLSGNRRHTKSIADRLIEFRERMEEPDSPGRV